MVCHLIMLRSALVGVASRVYDKEMRDMMKQTPSGLVDISKGGTVQSTVGRDCSQKPIV